jgi:hypothetical protein
VVLPWCRVPHFEKFFALGFFRDRPEETKRKPGEASAFPTSDRLHALTVSQAPTYFTSDKLGTSRLRGY